MNRLHTLLALLTSFSLVSCGCSDNSKVVQPAPIEAHGTTSTASSKTQESLPSVTALPSPEVAPDVSTPGETASETSPAPASTPDKPAKPKRQPIYDPQADAKALIAAAIERARLEHKHVLIEWGGNWCGWCYKLHDVFTRNETVLPIVQQEFEFLLVDSNSNDELMRSYGGRDRHYSYPHLTILDATGQVLTNQNTEPLEEGPQHDPVKVADFLKKWSPERLDAEALLSAALQQAMSEGKSVLLQVGGPYCGWCKVLSRFLDDHKGTFGKDYVHLKIDYMRMTHGAEVANRFAPEKNPGDPWMVILDPTGKVLATCMGPNGNIGYPFEIVEIDHFLTMLTTTRKRLTDADLAMIRQHLNAAREERLRKRQKQSAVQ